MCSSSTASPTPNVPDERAGPRDVRPVVDDDLDALAADLVLELVRGAPRDDLAVVDDRDGVGQLVRLLQVLGGQQQRGAFAHQAPDDVPHAQPAARVETGRRLVEEQQPRPPDERAAQVEASAHATGVGLDDPVSGVHQVELLQQLVGPLARLGARQLVQPAEHPQVLARRSGSRPPPRTGRTGR